MVTTIHDGMFTGEAVADPYTYYGRIGDEHPVQRNQLYELWVITGYGDLVGMNRRHELFSSEFWKRDTEGGARQRRRRKMTQGP